MRNQNEAERTGSVVDPVALARRDLKAALPRRFFARAEAAPCEGGFAIALDGRLARTPARNLLAVPERALAEAMAAEWEAQREHVDPSEMPLTRIVNSGLDGVAKHDADVVAEVVRYGDCDLVCYRAADCEPLAARQAQAWDRVLAYAQRRFDITLNVAAGLMHVAQPAQAPVALAAAVEQVAGKEPARCLRLAALHVMTTLTGSALLALAVADGFLPAQEAWTAAHVDEDFQQDAWGSDYEAAQRRERRWRDMDAAARIATALATKAASR